MTDWRWNPAAHRYQAIASGRFLSAAGSDQLRDHFLNLQRDRLAELADRVSTGDLTLGAWERQMRSSIKQLWTTEYAYGRGGRHAMTDANRAELGNLVTGQWTYLSGFARDLEAGVLTAEQVRARAQLYANAAVLAHAAGRGRELRGPGPVRNRRDQPPGILRLLPAVSGPDRARLGRVRHAAAAGQPIV
jgi:hypothetical protein